MDKIIEKKKGFAAAFTKRALPYWMGAMVVFFVLWLVFRDNSSTLRVNGDTLSYGTVTRGEFNDYIRVTGQVQPMTTIQISPLEGGVVQEIVTEEGSKVQKGDVILVLSNESLDLQILNSEAELAEKENLLRNTMISMEQQKLSVKQEMLQLRVEVRRSKRAFESARELYAEKLISKEEWLKAEEDYMLAKDRLDLVETRAQQDSLYRAVEIDQMTESLQNMRLNMRMIRKRKDNLTIKAPIDGELGLLDVALGQSIAAGVKVRDGCIVDKNKNMVPLSDEQLVVIGEYDLYEKALEDGLLKSMAKFSGDLHKFDGMTYLEALESLTERDMSNFIRDLHQKMFSKLSEKYDETRGGFYRTSPVSLAGTNVSTASPRMIGQVVDNISWRILETLKKSAKGEISNSDYVDEINSCIYEIIRAQPFADGNKRTSRLLSNILYQEKGLPYVLLPIQEWNNYVDAWSNDDISVYNEMMHRLILESYNYFYGVQSVGKALKGKDDGTKLINANRK